jgi:hypothetical protein
MHRGIKIQFHIVLISALEPVILMLQYSVPIEEIFRFDSRAVFEVAIKRTFSLSLPGT